MSMRRKIRIGSRDSLLAVKQTEIVANALLRTHPELEIELVTMKTTGDLNPDLPFDLMPQGRFGVKGLFVKELELALLDCRIDLAVHSLKDMPMEQNEDLPLLAFCSRGDPRDALVLPSGRPFSAEGDAGCSSARRRVQLRSLMPDRKVRSVRGNVLTRLRKLDGGEYAFLVLAAAGLQRIDLGHRITRLFSVEEMIPAAGQGILTCQGRREGNDLSFLDSVYDPDALDAALAERAFVRFLGGGCTLPVAAYAETSASELRLTGLYADEEKEIFRSGSISGNRVDAEKLGETLAHRLLYEE